MKPGDIVKETRGRRGLSQRELADAVGVSQVAIKKIESGDTVKSKHLAKIAEVLELELSSLDPSLRAKPSAVRRLSTKPIAVENSHPHFRNPDDMLFWNQGDGYRIDEPELATDEEIRAFLAPYITGGAKNKYEIWHILSDVIEKGPCKAGSYLVVEMGRQPNPQEIVLAITNDKKLPIFRYWVGRILVPAPLIPSKLPRLVEDRDAAVLGVVVAWYLPGAT